MFKHFTTLQARAALLGIELHAITNDLERQSFIATQGPITREFLTLGEVDAYLASVEGSEAVLCGLEGTHVP